MHAEDLAKLEAVYEEWREAEGRAAQWRAYRQQCAALPDTPVGRERERYLRYCASFSPAYLSGSETYRRRPHDTARRVLRTLGVLGVVLRMGQT
jgi:hypothetical protein